MAYYINEFVTGKELIFYKKTRLSIHYNLHQLLYDKGAGEGYNVK